RRERDQDALVLRVHGLQLWDSAPAVRRHHVDFFLDREQRAGVRGIFGLRISLVAVACWATAASGQTVTVVHPVNLRPDPSTEYPAMRLLTPSEPPLTLLDGTPESGYYHVRTGAGEEGYVWGREVRVSVTPLAAPRPSGPGVPGSASMVGCGDSLWQHVYHPSRLLVQQDCVTVTGVIVDATAGQAHHEPDGVRHEPVGDTHGWLQVDSQFAGLINPGNRSDEGQSRVRDRVPLHRHAERCAARLCGIQRPDDRSAPRLARRDH